MGANETNGGEVSPLTFAWIRVIRGRSSVIAALTICVCAGVD